MPDGRGKDPCMVKVTRELDEEAQRRNTHSRPCGCGTPGCVEAYNPDARGKGDDDAK